MEGRNIGNTSWWINAETMPASEAAARRSKER